MRLELLHIDGCPNSDRAHERLEQALAVLGRSEVKVDMRLLTIPSDIAGSGFAGSPTITIDGADISLPELRPMNSPAGSIKHPTASRDYQPLSS